MVDMAKYLCYNFFVDRENMEEYPSLVEGTGLENREVEQSAQGFESLFLRHLILHRGMEQSGSSSGS